MNANKTGMRMNAHNGMKMRSTVQTGPFIEEKVVKIWATQTNALMALMWMVLVVKRAKKANTNSNQD